MRFITQRQPLTSLGFILTQHPSQLAFTTIDALVRHYSKEPYMTDFAGHPRKLMDLTKVGNLIRVPRLIYTS